MKNESRYDSLRFRKGSVRFEGRVFDEALPRMCATADALVLPTGELDCFGLFDLEALATGRLPVHAPANVHVFAERGYSERRRLTELIAIALGDAS